MDNVNNQEKKPKPFFERAYFSFPLCVLAYPGTFYERFRDMLLYGMVELSRNETFRQGENADSTGAVHRIEDFEDDAEDEEQAYLLYTLERLHFHPDREGAATALRGHERMRKHISAFEQRHGLGKHGTAHVRFTAHFWALNDAAAIMYEGGNVRDVAKCKRLHVLFAVRAAHWMKRESYVGSPTEEQLRRFALGYQNKVIAEAEKGQRADGLHTLDRPGISRITNRLNADGLITKRTGIRKVYYSPRQDVDNLVEAAARRDMERKKQREAKRVNFQQLQRAIARSKQPGIVRPSHTLTHYTGSGEPVTFETYKLADIVKAQGEETAAMWKRNGTVYEFLHSKYVTTRPGFSEDELVKMHMAALSQPSDGEYCF